jgi:hypothetical protein
VLIGGCTTSWHAIFFERRTILRPLTIHIDSDLHYQFKVYAISRKASMSDLLRDFMQRTVSTPLAKRTMKKAPLKPYEKGNFKAQKRGETP